MVGGHRIVVVSRVLSQIAACGVFRVKRLYFVRRGWGIGIYPRMPEAKGARVASTVNPKTHTDYGYDHRSR